MSKTAKTTTNAKAEPAKSAAAEGSGLQKFYPYIFPALALVIAGMLAFRWYSMRTQRDGEVSPFGEGVEIENLSKDELDSVLKGTGNLKTVNMINKQDDAAGQIRYEIKDGRVIFSVSADLPQTEGVVYQVWLKSTDKGDYRKAFVLEYGKGGFYGSAAVSESVLPFEIVVSKETNPNDEAIEQIVLTGVIDKN